MKKVMGNSRNKEHIFIGTGISKHDDPTKAGIEAVSMAIKKMDNKIPDFAIVFCSAAKYGTKQKMSLIAKSIDSYLRKINPKIKWVGCTSKKEISNYGYTENSIVAMAIKTEYVHFGVGVGNKVLKLPEKAGKEAAWQAINDVKRDTYLDPYLHFSTIKTKQTHQILRTQPYFFMTLFPGCTKGYFPRDNLVIKGITSVTGIHPTFGGDASDNWTLTQTYVMANGKVYEDSLALVCIISNIKMGIGVKHGYEPTDTIAIVTKSKGNIVYELNHKSAAEVYCKMAHAKLEAFKKYTIPTLTKAPFGVADIQGDYWLNCPYAVTKENGLIFFEPVAPGTALYLMKPKNKKEYIRAAEIAINNATNELQELEGLIVFSCSARLMYLGEEIKKEYEVIKKVSKDKPFIGFCSYAEHATIPSGSIYKHGYTFVTFGMTNKLINE